MALSLPLEGVRIVDLTAVWAGPYATRVLGDMGAEVIKIESPSSPDMLRSLGFNAPETERPWHKSAYFNHNNRSKKSLTLDLAQEAGRDVFLELVAKSDVVIENFRAEVMDKLRIGYDVLKSVNPEIIFVSMPGHGKDGPERDYVAFGTNVEQLAGLVSLSGYVDGEPQKTGISYGDPVAGVAGAAAVVLALLARRRTGQGQNIEVAQRENLTSMIGEQVLAYQVTGQLPRRIGNRHPFWSPHGAYPCEGSDQWVTISCRSDVEFARLTEVIGRPDLATDVRFALSHHRHANQDELDAEVATWTSGRTRDDATALLVAAGIPAAPVLNHVDLYNDPHLRSRGFFERVHHADAGEWDMEGPVYRFRERPAHIRLNAPMFGEHNEYVLRELLGKTSEQIAELEAAHVIGNEPNMSVHQ